MYTKPQAAAQAKAATHAARLAELRYMVLDTVNYSPYTTADEKARTAASVARCQDAAVLVKWYCNVLTELAARETAPVVYATGAQKEALVRLCNHALISRPVKTKVLLNLNRYTAAQATALMAELTALTTPPTRPAGAGVTLNRKRQLAVAAWTRYAGKAVAYQVANN